MDKIKIKQLKNYFTMSKKTIRKLYETLEVDNGELMKTIIDLTKDMENVAKAEPAFQLLYFSEMAYKQGYVRALYELNEANKQTIKDLAEM